MKNDQGPHFDATFPSFVRRARRESAPEPIAPAVCPPEPPTDVDPADTVRRRQARAFFRRAFGRAGD